VRRAVLNRVAESRATQGEASASTEKVQHGSLPAADTAVRS